MLLVALFDTVMVSLHLVFSDVWTGSVVFVTIADLPTARDGSGSPESLGRITNSLETITRVRSLALLTTGGHMAGTYYTTESLTGSTRGHLVLGMVALSFLLTALTEIGGKNLLTASVRTRYVNQLGQCAHTFSPRRPSPSCF